MYGGHMDGWDRLYGGLMMLSWAVVVGVAVYAAIRLSQRHGRE
jgi:hypothetical protein